MMLRGKFAVTPLRFLRRPTLADSVDPPIKPTRARARLQTLAASCYRIAAGRNGAVQDGTRRQSRGLNPYRMALYRDRKSVV